MIKETCQTFKQRVCLVEGWFKKRKHFKFAHLSLVPEEIRCIFFPTASYSIFFLHSREGHPGFVSDMFGFLYSYVLCLLSTLSKPASNREIIPTLTILHFTYLKLPRNQENSALNRHQNGVAVSGTGRWGKEAQCSTKGNMPQGPPKSASAGIHASTYLGSGDLLQLSRTPSYIVTS